MRKILFITPSLGMGGMERVLVNYANLFQKHNYDVTIYNLTSGDEIITKYINNGIHYYERYCPVPNLIRADLKQILNGNFRILKWQKWFDKKSDSELHNIYVNEHFDIEVAFFGMESIKIVSGCCDRKTIKLAWIHGEQKENDYAPISSFKEAVSFLNSMNKIICVSQGALESVKKVYGIKRNLYVINNPNDSKKIRELADEEIDLEKNNFTFVNASRFDDKQKGYSRMLDICKKLNKDGYNYNLWLLGDGIDYNKIKARIINENINNVRLIGKQDNPYKYMRKADMYICFSYSEGFSMVMMEAVILGLPMMSTDVPGAKEMLDNGKYGIIVDNNEESIYKAIEKVLDNKEILEKYKELANKRKDYLNENSIFTNLERIIYK